MIQQSVFDSSTQTEVRVLADSTAVAQVSLATPAFFTG